MTRPTPSEQSVIAQWLQLPSTKEQFINDASGTNLEKVFVLLKNRGAEYRRTREGFTEVPPTREVEASRAVTINNLNEVLSFLLDRAEEFNNWDTVRKSSARLAHDEKERRDKTAAVAAENERVRIANDPVLKAQREQKARDAEAAKEKALFEEQARALPGENSLQTLQRFAAFKDSYERKKYPRPTPSSTPHADTLRRTAAETKLLAADQESFLNRKYSAVTSPEPTPTNFTTKNVKE